MTVTFGHGRLGVRVDELRAAADDALPLLAGAGQEPGNVHKGQNGDVERVAGAHEPGRLLRRRDVEATGEVQRLVGHDPDRPALDPAEADHDVLRVERVHLEELAVVEHVLDDPVHVVGLVGRVGDERVEFEVGVGHPTGRPARRRPTGSSRLFEGRYDSSARTYSMASVLIGGEVVRVAALGVVGAGAAELLEADVLAGDRLDDVRPGDEHVAGLVDHHGEVGDRRRVDGAAGARAHDERDLRDHAAGPYVAEEDLAVEPERDDALLDPRPAGVVDARPPGSRSSWRGPSP